MQETEHRVRANGTDLMWRQICSSLLQMDKLFTMMVAVMLGKNEGIDQGKGNGEEGCKGGNRGRAAGGVKISSDNET